MNTKEAVKNYQCPGCVCGSGIECYEGFSEKDMACEKHVAGTSGTGMGTFYLGMKKGFNRKGPVKELKINIFEKFSDGWGYDKYNIPIWKHKDEFGNTIVRGLSPRVNFPFIHIFLEDCIDEIECLEINDADLEGMD